MDQFNQVLAEVAASTLHIGNPFEEARKNTSRLSLDAEHGRLPNTRQIQAFIHEARSTYATIAKGIDVEVLRFYAWFDEQAGQLRLSASSAQHLPFGVPIVETAEARLVAEAATASNYSAGIPWSDFEMDGDDPVDDSSAPPLIVYVATILERSNS